MEELQRPFAMKSDLDVPLPKEYSELMFICLLTQEVTQHHKEGLDYIM